MRSPVPTACSPGAAITAASSSARPSLRSSRLAGPDASSLRAPRSAASRPGHGRRIGAPRSRPGPARRSDHPAQLILEHCLARRARLARLPPISRMLRPTDSFGVEPRFERSSRGSTRRPPRCQTTIIAMLSPHVLVHSSAARPISSRCGGPETPPSGKEDSLAAARSAARLRAGQRRQESVAESVRARPRRLRSPRCLARRGFAQAAKRRSPAIAHLDWQVLTLSGLERRTWVKVRSMMGAAAMSGTRGAQPDRLPRWFRKRRGSGRSKASSPGTDAIAATGAVASRPAPSYRAPLTSRTKGNALARSAKSKAAQSAAPQLPNRERPPEPSASRRRRTSCWSSTSRCCSSAASRSAPDSFTASA